MHRNDQAGVAPVLVRPTGRPALPRLPSVRAMVRTAAVIAAIAMGIGVFLTWRLGSGAWSGALLAALPALVALGTGSQGFRFLRWHVLVTRRAPALRAADSMRIYITGFALELTPGRLGAFLKFSLLRQVTGVPEADTVAVLPVEAAAEVVSFLLVATAGAVAGGYRLPQVGAGVLVGALLLLGLLLLSSSRRWTGRRGNPRLVDRLPLLDSLYRGLLAVGSPGPVLLALGCALAARACEVVLFGVVAHVVVLPLSPAGATLAWGMSGLVGGVSLLPGGFGAAEGAVVATVASIGGKASLALVAALVSRMMTVWIWIPVGLACAVASTRGPGGLSLIHI